MNFDSAIIICTQEMLFHQINSNKTIKYLNKIIKDNEDSNLSKTCQFNLNSYNKGHLYVNIFSKSHLFSLNNVLDYISFNEIVLANTTSFSSIPPWIVSLYCESHFNELFIKGGLKNYVLNTTQMEREKYLSYCGLNNNYKKILKVEMEESKKIDYMQPAELSQILNFGNLDEYENLLNDKITSLMKILSTLS